MVTATLLDGKTAAGAIKAELTARVAALRAAGEPPGLGTILVGDDPGSRAYVAGKHRDCEQVGITSTRAELPATASQAQVEHAVRDMNADPAVTGFIVQLPLPRHVDTHAVLEDVANHLAGDVRSDPQRLRDLADVVMRVPSTSREAAGRNPHRSSRWYP